MKTVLQLYLIKVRLVHPGYIYVAYFFVLVDMRSLCFGSFCFWSNSKLGFSIHNKEQGTDNPIILLLDCLFLGKNPLKGF